MVADLYSLIQNLIILLSLIFALVNLKKILGNRYLQLFPIYTLVSLIVDVTYYFDKPFGNLEINLFVIFEFIIFYRFYWLVLADNKNRKILKILFFVYIILLLIMVFMYHDRYKLNLLKLLEKRTFFEMMAMDNILLVLPVILYYKSLFLLPIKKLNNNSIFLVMTGILFGFSIMIPIDATFLLIKSYNKELFLYMYVLNALGYILIHLFIIKAYLSLK